MVWCHINFKLKVFNVWQMNSASYKKSASSLAQGLVCYVVYMSKLDKQQLFAAGITQPLSASTITSPRLLLNAM